MSDNRFVLATVKALDVGRRYPSHEYAWPPSERLTREPKEPSPFLVRIVTEPDSEEGRRRPYRFVGNGEVQMSIEVQIRDCDGLRARSGCQLDG